jgi:hypothetical protein
MAVKFVIDKLEDVDEALRPHYVAENGKYRLDTQGEHPKVTEFRVTNIEQKKELAKFDGIDPEAVKAERLELAELKRAQPTVAELQAELARERSARTDAQQRADSVRVRDTLRTKALAAGALPAALDMILDKAEPQFTIVDNAVQARPNVFSRARPGELLTPDEWMADAIREMSFLFGRSSGGGATHHRGVSGDARIRELHNPTPQQLGEHAAAIARGEIKVVNS